MWSEPILHVDMDSFFVEVERAAQPVLRGKAVAVGGSGARGVIASASYEARQHGVSSAQPTAIALQLCPGLVVIPPDHRRYREISARVFAVFRSFTPLVEGVGLDEAFLDIGGLHRHHPSPVEVGEKIRSRLGASLGLPASVGVASNKLIAKLASEAAKPDGLTHVPFSSQLDFLHALPASSLWGVGPATLAVLQRMGISTVGDLSQVPEQALVAALGPASGRHLHALSRGQDPRQIEPDQDAKSISVEETYPNDLTSRSVLETALLAHAQRLSGRLHRSGVAAKTITLKVRYDDFETKTRSHTAATPISGARDLFQTALRLLGSVDSGRPVRLVGLGAASLQPSGAVRQPALDETDEWYRVEEAVAAVRDRFGDGSVTPARLVELPGEEPE